MAFIYCIINDINQKIYIGKTYQTIDKRFQEHCNDAFRERNKNRPLYIAMRKYGIEHFHIKQIEETNNPEEREKYWIEYYGSFKNGYNATIGGDGKPYADYDLIFALWKQGKNNLEIQKILKYDKATIVNALNNKGVLEQERKERGIQSRSQSIAMLDINTKEVLKVFPSTEAAYRFLGKNTSGHISAVCQGKRKSAYGYSWKKI